MRAYATETRLITGSRGIQTFIYILINHLFKIEQQKSGISKPIKQL